MAPAKQTSSSTTRWVTLIGVVLFGVGVYLVSITRLEVNLLTGQTHTTFPDLGAGIPLAIVGLALVSYGRVVARSSQNRALRNRKEELYGVRTSPSQRHTQSPMPRSGAITPISPSSAVDRCHGCGQPLTPDASFCVGCGLAIVEKTGDVAPERPSSAGYCIHCGSPSNADAKFCTACGERTSSSDSP